tara:strand:+ start:2435 stop:2596 length:162 start_codon:yes stop_codon:yes gene_type:complete
MRRKHKLRSVKGDKKVKIRFPVAKPGFVLKAKKGVGYDRLTEKRQFRKELEDV